MSDKQQPWTEERIIAEAEALAAHFKKYDLDHYEMSRLIVRAMRQVKDSLQQRVTELEAENERLNELLLSIQHAEFKPGELTVEGISPVVAVLAEGCYEMLKHRDAENYVQFAMMPKSGERGVHVTVAWADGKLPATRVIETEAERDQWRTRAQALEAELARVREWAALWKLKAKSCRYWSRENLQERDSLIEGLRQTALAQIDRCKTAEAELTKLRAETWRPVDDYNDGALMALAKEGMHWLGVNVGGEGNYYAIVLPDDLRLCKRTG